jgi:hypothetical protein
LAKLDRIRAHGIHVTAGFIVGFDGEDKSVFAAQRRFIQDSGVGVAMVGLLQAIPHTQLYRRLRKEGRLLERLDLRGSLTIEGINFVPKGEMTKRHYLENYRTLVRDVYDPKAYFERILPALIRLRTKLPPGVLWRHGWTLLAVLIREIYHLGIRAKTARGYFWRTFLQLLRQNPAALEGFAFDSSVFYHLHRHAGYVERELSRYVSAPAAGDVLDRVVGPNGERNKE